MDKVFEARKESGVFRIVNEKAMKDYVRALADGSYNLVIKQRKKSRSNQQNRYLWGVVYKIIAEETGHSEDEVHEHMKWRYLRKRGGKLETVRSTTSLSTMEFEEYTENIRRFAATELNIQIPLPNEIDYE